MWIFYANSSNDIGVGHAIRLLSVAEYVCSLGYPVVFCYQRCLPEVRAMWQALISDCWDLSDEGEEKLSRANAQVVVYDLYGLSSHTESILSRLRCLTVAFDDAAEVRTLPADIVVNASPAANARWYRGYQPNSLCLLGSAYTPIREKFTNSRLNVPFEERKRLLIFMGGTDVKRLSLPLAEGLSASGKEITVVVLSQEHPDFSVLRGLEKKGRIALFKNPSNLPELMAGAGLAVSGGGGTLNELATLKVPTLVLALADNQIIQLDCLVKYGWCVGVDAREWTGVGCSSLNEFTPFSRFVDQVEDLWASKNTRENMSDMAEGYVDGRGCERIVGQVMLKLREPISKITTYAKPW